MIQKTLTLWLTIFWISQSLFAQSITTPLGMVTYRTKLKLHTLETYQCTLTFDKDQSLFLWNKSSKDGISTDDEGNLVQVNHTKDKSVQYTNYNTQTLKSRANVYQTDWYIIEEKIPQIQWNITSQTKKIGNYDVIKATCEFRGRKYDAWFAPIIPMRFGPWKLQGLPGLILEASDNSGEIAFSLQAITKEAQPIALKLKEKTIDIETYFQKEIDYPFEQLKRIQSKNPSRTGSVVISGVNYNFMEKVFEKLANKRKKQVETGSTH